MCWERFLSPRGKLFRNGPKLSLMDRWTLLLWFPAERLTTDIWWSRIRFFPVVHNTRTYSKRKNIHIFANLSQFWKVESEFIAPQDLEIYSMHKVQKNSKNHVKGNKAFFYPFVKTLQKGVNRKRLSICHLIKVYWWLVANVHTTGGAPCLWSVYEKEQKEAISFVCGKKTFKKWCIDILDWKRSL